MPANTISGGVGCSGALMIPLRQLGFSSSMGNSRERSVNRCKPALNELRQQRRRGKLLAGGGARYLRAQALFSTGKVSKSRMAAERTACWCHVNDLNAQKTPLLNDYLLVMWNIASCNHIEALLGAGGRKNDEQ